MTKRDLKMLFGFALVIAFLLAIKPAISQPPHPCGSYNLEVNSLIKYFVGYWKAVFVELKPPMVKRYLEATDSTHLPVERILVFSAEAQPTIALVMAREIEDKFCVVRPSPNTIIRAHRPNDLAKILRGTET